MSAVTEVLESQFFLVGLRFGLAALGVGWLVVLLRGRSRPVLPVGGVLVAVVFILAVMVGGSDVGAEAIALLLVVAGLGLARYFQASSETTALATIPGAFQLASVFSNSIPLWTQVLVVVAIPVGGYLAADFESRRSGSGMGVVFYAAAVLGVFLAVPDTEWARALLAVVVPIGFLAWPKPVVILGSEGAYVAVAVLVAVAVQGGATRPSSILGGLACLGFLLIEPVANMINPRVGERSRSIDGGWATTMVLSVPQLILVFMCSRVAARFESVLPALAVVAVTYAAGLSLALVAANGRGAMGSR